jgi:hypothetical protein
MKKCCNSKFDKLPKKIFVLTIEALLGTIVLKYLGRLLQALGCSLTAPLLSILIFVLVLSVVYVLLKIIKVTFNKCRIKCDTSSCSKSSSSSSSSCSKFYTTSSCSSSISTISSNSHHGSSSSHYDYKKCIKKCLDKFKSKK